MLPNSSVRFGGIRRCQPDGNYTQNAQACPSIGWAFCIQGCRKTTPTLPAALLGTAWPPGMPSGQAGVRHREEPGLRSRKWRCGLWAWTLLSQGRLIAVVIGVTLGEVSGFCRHSLHLSRYMLAGGGRGSRIRNRRVSPIAPDDPTPYPSPCSTTAGDSSSGSSSVVGNSPQQNMCRCSSPKHPAVIGIGYHLAIRSTSNFRDTPSLRKTTTFCGSQSQKP